MKRLIGVLLAVAMLVTLIPVAVFADGEEERLVYQSSTNFSIEAGDGTWDGGVWKAMFYEWEDATGTERAKYKDMSSVKDENYVSYYTEYDNYYNWGDRSVHLGATGMSAEVYEYSTTTKWNAKDDEKNGAVARDYPVRAFVAPKDGTVSISAAVLAPETEGSNQNIRIMKMGATSGEPVRVWPASGYYNLSAQVDFEPITTTLAQGDMLLFEAVYIYNNDQPGSVLNWDPIITYTEGEENEDIPAPTERDKFRSAEYYDTTGETAKWDSGVWQAWFYDWDDTAATTERAKYKLMVGTRTDDNIVKWTNNEKSEAGSYNWNSNAAQVGPEFMRVEFIPNANATTYEKTYSEEVFSYPIGRDYPVKVFVAPKSGYVSIGAETMTLPFETHGSKVRIMKMGTSGEPVQIWPASGFKAYAAGTTINFEAVGTTVEAGDMLMFECAFIFGDGFSSPYGGAINWDPTIEYTEAPAVDPDPPTDKTKYISSEDFDTTSGNGTWGDVWSANAVNFTTNTYTAITAVGTRGDASCWKQDGVIVDVDEIVPYAGSKANAAANNHIGAAKTFTAPKDGFVQISYAPVTNHNTGEQHGVSVFQLNRQMSFRVRHESGNSLSTVYPLSSEYVDSLTSWEPPIYEMIAANTATKTLEIKQGDKLHFEVKKTVTEEDNYNGIYCDPIVEYIDEEDVPDDPLANDPADKRVYKSSENFSDIQNGDYAWKWQYYDINTKKYNNLTHVSQMQSFGFDPDEKATIWYLPQNTQYNKDRGISVGAVGMRVSIDEPDDVATDGEKNGEIERNYPVKSFTAPKRGEVTISADIFEPGHTSGGAALRIIKHSADGTQTKLYPTDAEWINIYPGDTFTNIKTELEKGDILTFENSLWKNNSAWQAIIRWDPVITYTKLIPVVDDCNTEIGEVDVPLNKEHVLTYSGDIAAPSASEIKIYEVASDGTKTESNATIKSITADGKDLKIVFDGLKPYTEYEVEVGGVAFEATPNDKASNTITFTTGPVVMIGEAEYAGGKVTVDVNNSQESPAKATLAVFLCKGTETEYTVENVRIVTRTDIGANDSIEAAITIPSGDYFIKAMVLEDALTARAYAPMTILKGEN